MPRVDLRATGEVASIPAGGYAPFVMERTLNCATDNVGSADVVEILNIPAGVIVEEVLAIVETPEGGTLTIDVGDDDTEDSEIDRDGYLDGINGNSEAVNTSRGLILSEGTPNTITPPYYKGKYYSAAAVLVALFNNAADTAVIRFILKGMYVGT